MTDANVKFVQDVYGAFGRGDIPTVLDALAPDVSWGMVGRPEDFPPAGIRSGKAGAGEFFRLLKETQQITRFEPLTFSAVDDKVFVSGRAEWIMCQSGVVGENEWLHVFTIRDGKVTMYRGYQDTGTLAEAYHASPAAKRAAT